jgi:hypothetical protein
MEETRRIEIWFFIGSLLFVYGLLILGAGVYHLMQPPIHQVALVELHADIWWGVLLLALGLFYTIKFWPTTVQRFAGKQVDHE